MLNPVRRAGLVSLALLLAACGPTPRELPEAVAVEATYRLQFNDVLVGHALFALKISSDGAYSIDAFTTPAGQMRQDSVHEVLENSRGKIDSRGVRPERFDRSVMLDREVTLQRLAFDWEHRRLRYTAGKEARVDALLPGTQDRLSYLLAAWRMVTADEAAMEIQIASVEAVEQTRLEVIGEETIEIPLGRYETVAVRRSTPQPNQIRAIWFKTDLSPLPLRVVHGWAGSTVDMQLESLSRNPDRPR
jgi:hypothetical protein